MHNHRVNSLNKSVLARLFRHEGEGRMNWRTRSTNYSPSCPLVRTSGVTYRTVLTNGRDENTSCRVGNECTIRQRIVGLSVNGSLVYVTVAYPGGFSGCPETPPPTMIFLIYPNDTLTGTDLHQPLIFVTFGNPP